MDNSSNSGSAHQRDVGGQHQTTDLARLQQELAHARADLAAVVGSVSSQVGYWDTELKLCFANRQYAAFLGRTAEQIVGLPMHEVLEPRIYERNLPHARAALAGETRVFERRISPRDAPARFVSVSYVPDWREGRVAGFCVLVTDVSRAHDADLALAQSEERYRALFEHMQTGFALHEVVLDAQGVPVDYVFLACNPAYTAMTGLTPEKILGRRVTEALPGTEKDPADWIGVFGKVAITGRSVHLQNYSEAISRWYDVVAYSPGKNLFAVLLQDVTEQRRASAELAAEHERVRVTLHSIGDGVITTDRNGRVEYLNPVAERLTGWTAELAAGRPLMEVFQVVDEGSRAPSANPVDSIIARERDGEHVDRRVHDPRLLIARDGREYNISDSVAPIRGDQGAVLGAVLVFNDITEQRALAREMSHRATHDALTQLPNRAEFDHRLQRELGAAQQSGLAHALLYIDLDQFKIVNDACGHAVGDLLLQQVGEVLRSCVRAGDTLARLGGDEFGVILAHCDSDAALRIGQDMCDRIEEFRFVHENHRFRVGASIGVVPLDRRWPNTAAVLQAADAACYSAKEAGRNRVHAYTDPAGSAQERQGQMRWVTRLQQAIEEDRFTLYCQKIASLHPQDAGEHYEILVRMLAENGDIILPGAFIPAAERYQLAGRVDRWVLRQVLQWMQANRPRLATISTIAINLSGQSIGDRSFHRYAEELMRDTNGDGSKICFEITETAAISNLGDATHFFEAMKVQGCRFALDDFGSGLSSFAYLKSLPVDYLKIDGQFVRDAHTDAVDRATVRCIQEVAHVVGKQTIAEFAESLEVCQLLRDMGVDYAQGYAIHRPEPLANLTNGGLAPGMPFDTRGARG